MARQKTNDQILDELLLLHVLVATGGFGHTTPEKVRSARRAVLARMNPPIRPSSRADLDRMADAIHALPGKPVMGKAIGDGR